MYRQHQYNVIETEVSGQLGFELLDINKIKRDNKSHTEYFVKV